jgi:hypothetical protein
LLLELALPPVVFGELRDEAAAEDAQRRDQRVDLVQRVGPPRLRVDVEHEVDPLAAVRDLEDRPRLEVVDPLVVLVVAVARLELTLARALDVGDDVRAAVEAGRFRNRRSSTRARYGMPMLGSLLGSNARLGTSRAAV